MKFLIDKKSIKPTENNKYDERGLSICTCGKHRYPSKKMIYDWLKKEYPDVKGTAEIWSMRDYEKDEVIITLELKYKVGDLPHVIPKTSRGNV